MGIKLLSENSSHIHILYIPNDSTETELISTNNNGHSHVIGMDGLVVTNNGHTHELSNVEIVSSDEPEKDNDIVNTCWGLYKDGKLNEEDSLKDAQEAEDFWAGDQWDAGDKETLKSEARACLTINEIKPKIDLLSGYQRQNRTDIKYLPVEDGDRRVADVYNKVSKNILERCSYDYEETFAFEDQMKVGRGNLVLDIDTEESITGDIKVYYKRWDEVLWGYHNKLDGSDAEYCIAKSFVTMNKLKSLYPDKAKDIEEDWSELSFNSNKDHVSYPVDQYKHAEKSTIINFDSNDKEVVDIASKKFLIIYVYRREYKKVPVCFDLVTNESISLEGVTDKNVVKSINQLQNCKLVYVTKKKIRITVIAGRTLLDDGLSPFSDINIVPVYANKLKNKFWGKVREAMDSQRELNKRHSQSIDIINKMASYGIGYDSEAFDSPREEESFKKNRMKPGFLGKFKVGFQNHIKEFEGVKYPSEVVALAEMSSQKINTLMNISPEMLGFSTSANQSGVVFNQKVRAGMVGNEYLFDNLSLAKRKIGRLLLEAINLVYTSDDIIRIIDNIALSGKLELGGKEFYPNYSQDQLIGQGLKMGAFTQEQAQTGQIDEQALQKVADAMYNSRRNELKSILDNADVGKYDVVVSESNSTPTVMMGNYMILQELFRNNPNAPLGALISLIPNLSEDVKESLLADMKATSDAQVRESEMKSQTELEKSRIASEGKQNKGQAVP